MTFNLRAHLRHRKITNWLAIKRLQRSQHLSFTQDYVTHLAPIWKAHLGEFNGRENLRMLEIGCFEGRSTIWFLENVLTHHTANLTGIDYFLFPLREARFDHNLKLSGHSAKLIKLKGRSDTWLHTLATASFDIIYIDGAHDAPNVMLDTMQSWRLLKPGGVLIFDDYAWKPEKPPHLRPQMAIDLFLETIGEQLEILHKDYQVIIRKK